MRTGIQRVAATGIIAIGVLLAGATWHSLGRQRPTRPTPGLMSVSFVDFSTNAAGQKCLRYQLRNGSAQVVLALAELQNGPPNSSLFVRLTNSLSQTIDLPEFPTTSPYRLQISCFVEDRGLMTQAYRILQRLRGQPIHEISKLLFTLPGPVVEPQAVTRRP